MKTAGLYSVCEFEMGEMLVPGPEGKWTSEWREKITINLRHISTVKAAVPGSVDITVMGQPFRVRGDYMEVVVAWVSAKMSERL